MHNQVGGKHVFLVLGCSLILFSPIILLVIPTVIPMTFYFEKYTWAYYTPKENYWVFGVGIATLVLCCAILFFGKLKKWAVSVGIILTVLSCFLFYGSAKSFIVFADEGITYRGLFETEKKLIGWGDITHVVLEEVVPGNSGHSTFIFYLKDGEELSFIENANISGIRGGMRAKFQQYSIPMEHIEVE